MQFSIHIDNISETKEMVKSKASIGGHPIHTALIALPIGLLTGTVLADVAYLFVSKDTIWLDISFWTNVAGVVTALLAAVFGFIDYFTIARGTAGKIATVHMVLNLTMVVLFSAALFFFPRGIAAPNVLLPFTLHFLGFGLMMAAGYLGGELVFRHKLGVTEEHEVEMHEPIKPLTA
jgi:uncharacterized membrane protein